MTCDHCVQAVTSELAQLPGVESVRVDLAANSVTVVSSEPLETAAVAAAVDDAGYQLAS